MLNTSLTGETFKKELDMSKFENTQNIIDFQKELSNIIVTYKKNQTVENQKHKPNISYLYIRDIIYFIRDINIYIIEKSQTTMQQNFRRQMVN